MNSAWVDQKIMRGEHPLTSEHLQFLKSQGIQTILNLERGWFEFFHGVMNWEFDRAEALGMTPYHLQLGDLLCPTNEDMDAAVSVLATVGTGKVYVHCMHGVDRTGMAVAAYRVKHCGYTPAKALDEMLAMGFHLFPYSVIWLPWFKRYLGA